MDGNGYLMFCLVFIVMFLLGASVARKSMRWLLFNSCLVIVTALLRKFPLPMDEFYCVRCFVSSEFEQILSWSVIVMGLGGLLGQIAGLLVPYIFGRPAGSIKAS